MSYGYEDDEGVYEPRLDQESPLHTENPAVIVENAVSPLVNQNPTLSSTLNLGHHPEETSDLNVSRFLCWLSWYISGIINSTGLRRVLEYVLLRLSRAID